MDEKEESAPETEEASNWPLPNNIGIDKLDLIVKAFFQAKADTQRVSLTDLPGRTGININTIKRNMKFLVAIGILKPPENESYTFEPKGITYAKALATNNDATILSTLKELVTNSYLKELIDYAINIPSLTYEQIFQHIKGMARLKEDPKYKPWGVAGPYASGIGCIISLLVRARIIPQDILAQKENVRNPTTAKMSVAPQRKATMAVPNVQQNGGEAGSEGVAIQGNINAIPFTLNITIEVKDSESIKQLIAVIKELKGESQQEEANP